MWLLDVAAMREDRNGAYTVFCEHVLSHVVGRDIWKRLSHNRVIGDISTVSDEAFALFLLENGWDVWKALADGGTGHKRAQLPTTKYSLRGPGTKKFQGWTEQGITRFNELFDKVKENRLNDEGVFEKDFMQEKMESIINKRKPRQKQNNVPDIMLIQARIEQPREELCGVRLERV